MRAYRWFLRLCPSAFRRAYGAAMEDTFARRLADARGQGAWRRAHVWRRELAGLVALAVSERWRGRQDQQKRLRPHRAEDMQIRGEVSASARGGGAAFAMLRRASPKLAAIMRERRRGAPPQLEKKKARMDVIGQEIRHAARRLRRSPAFTLAAVLTLALAIGANASIFAVVQHVVLNPLPYPDSDRLIELDHGALVLNLPANMGITLGLYYYYSDRARTLNGVALYRTDDLTLTGDGEPERIRVSRATTTLASVMRVPPALGRWFTEKEGVPGAQPVAVLSHGLWMRRYGSDPGVLGRPVMLGGVPTEIVGVMPPSYAFPDPQVDVWIAEPVTRASGFGLWNYHGVARLRDGVTVADASAELTRLIADLPRAFANDPHALGNAETRLVVTPTPLKEAIIGSVARALWILLASVGLVLVVACANVANLFLVRSEARQRDVAVRRALGASGASIARYFLAESVLLSITGGAIGLVIASGAVRLLVGFGPSTLPRLEEVRLDGVALAFTFVSSLLSGVAFGAIPLWRGTQLAASLHESGRSNTASRGRHRARHLLMGAQIALALVLLVSSGLMIRSFQRLRAVDPGFNATSALTFTIGLPERDYRSPAAAVAAHHAILDRLSSLPGVTAVSASTCLPLTGGCSGNTVRVEGRVFPRGTVPPLALFRAVAGGYFETMGIRVIRGRSINRSDVERKEQVVVVNQALADRFFPNEDPIGRRVASNRLSNLTWLTIVGVVSDTPVRTLAEAHPFPQLFMPMSIAGGPGIPRSALVGPDAAVMSYVVRSAVSPLGLLPSVRRVIDTVDKNLALAQVRTLQDTLDRASSQMAFTMVLLAIAAGVTLMLGMIGIYGVMSYIVSQRTGEIGVRLALGAEPGSVAGMIVRQGALVALGGITVGLAIALAGSRLIESLLYGVSPRDPGVFAMTTLILLGVALVACWLPARRAARLSPLEALRTE
jgi:predicted permease